MGGGGREGGREAERAREGGREGGREGEGKNDDKGGFKLKYAVVGNGDFNINKTTFSVFSQPSIVLL